MIMLVVRVGRSSRPGEVKIGSMTRPCETFIATNSENTRVQRRTGSTTRLHKRPFEIWCCRTRRKSKLPLELSSYLLASGAATENLTNDWCWSLTAEVLHIVKDLLRVLLQRLVYALLFVPEQGRLDRVRATGVGLGYVPLKLGQLLTSSVHLQYSDSVPTSGRMTSRSSRRGACVTLSSSPYRTWLLPSPGILLSSTECQSFDRVGQGALSYCRHDICCA